MPGSDKDKPGILEGVQKAAQEPFVNTLIYKVGESFANTIIPSTIPVISFLNSPVAAAAGAVGCYFVNEAKRKATSDSTKEIEYGVREHSDDFQYVYNNDEIANKRPCVVDNYVSREEREKELDKLFDIPNLVTNFVEREEFKELSKNFETKCSIQVVTSQVSIVGLGGIGKTQLAARFVEKNKGEYKDNFWIDAERYCINDSFNRLAKEIGISPQANATCLARDVYKKLNNQKTLIIFDNVDDYDSVKSFLPHKDYEAIHVLITSRYNKWENTGVHTVQLGVFTPKESKEFIKKELKIDDDEEAEKLHNKLQGLPLALQQAVAYIKQQRNVDSEFGIKNYLNEYDKSYEEAEKLLNYDLHEKNNDPYMKTVMTTWQVTLDKIEKNTECGKEAIRILNVMAYLAPDNIHNSMFLSLYELGLSGSEFKKQKEEIRNKVTNATDLLKSYSMINQESESNLSNIHRLVQEVIRIDLKNKGKEKEFLSDAIYCLGHSDQDNLRSFVLVAMYASQYKKLDSSVWELSQRFCDSDVTREIDNFQDQSSATQEKDRFLEVNKVILKSCFISNDYKMIEFLIENVKSYYLLREQSEDWKTTLLDGIEGYYTSKKEMLYHLQKLGLEIKFDCVKNLTSNSSWLTMAKFFVEQGVLCKQEDLSELLKKAQNYLDSCKSLENDQKCKIQERISKGLEVKHEQKVKESFKSSQEEIKNFISLIESKQSTLRDSDLEGFEVIDADEEKPPVLELCEGSIETLENDLNDAIEESPRSIVHDPLVTHSGQMYSKGISSAK